MEDIFGEILREINYLENLDGQIIIKDDTQTVGTNAQKMPPSLSQQLARAQTDEQAMAYAKLEELKQGNPPEDEAEHEKLIDLYAEEVIDKLLNGLN